MTLFIVFLVLAIYNAGNMTTLQLQHYGIYPAVPKEGFAEYMRANNRAAALPTILPAILLLLASVGLVIFRPVFINPFEGIAAFWLNFFAFMSTLLWQRRLQGEMAVTGYDERKVKLLIRTNWIRTICYWLLAALAIVIVVRLVPRGVAIPS
ncbi:MAG TPA: hypothetical protein VF908_01505 [Gemmatimonadaceae bacterium]